MRACFDSNKNTKKAGIVRLLLIGFVSVSLDEVSVSDVFTLATNKQGFVQVGK